MSTPRVPRHLRQRVRGELSPDDLAYLEHRYGPSRPSWTLWTVCAVVVLCFGAWVIWAGLHRAGQDVRWNTAKFAVDGDSSVTLTFDVTKPQQRAVDCLVRAFDDTGVEVGRATVPVEAERDDVRVVYALPVTSRASSALVQECYFAR